MRGSGHLLTWWRKGTQSHGMDCGACQRVNKNVTSLRNRSGPKLPPSASQNHSEWNFCQSMLSPSLTLTQYALSWTTPVGTSHPTWWSCRMTSWGFNSMGCIHWVSLSCRSSPTVLVLTLSSTSLMCPPPIANFQCTHYIKYFRL